MPNDTQRRRAGRTLQAPVLPCALEVVYGACTGEHSLDLGTSRRNFRPAMSTVGSVGRHHWPPRRTSDDLDVLCQYRQCSVLRRACLECVCCVLLLRARLPSHLGDFDRRCLRGPHGVPLDIHDYHSIARVCDLLRHCKILCLARWNDRQSSKNALDIGKNCCHRPELNQGS